jgi:hypothetical protein
VRTEAVDALGTLAPVPALDAVRAILRADSSALVRAAAAETLGDLGVNILNIWDDLTRRRHPPTLTLDAPMIVAALDRVVHRLPALRPHAEELAARLHR